MVLHRMNGRGPAWFSGGHSRLKRELNFTIYDTFAPPRAQFRVSDIPDSCYFSLLVSSCGGKFSSDFPVKLGNTIENHLKPFWDRELQTCNTNQS